MKKASVILDRDYIISPIDKRVYGSFIEHLGRAVYGGIYEPGHPTADEEGFRGDVLDMVRKLGVPVVRYPGGNFVSGFNWEDSIGPVKDRPKRLDLAWFVTETNEVGLHEFASWAKKANSEVMYAVNLGTRGAKEAREVVEYANHPSGTALSDLRRKNGAEEPFGIKLWCLGNEMDGPWQMGRKTAFEYGRIANEAAKVMKLTDPTIETVACGSSSFVMPTFGEWEYTMLNECYDNVDYVSLHRYYGNPTGDTPSFLASSEDLNDFVRTVASICDTVKGIKHSNRQVNLSLDEWNVWYHSNQRDEELHKTAPWGKALPLLEDVYNFEDALLVGSMLITILKNSDRIKVACMAQLVNVIAPIMTRDGGGCWAQTIYYPYMHASAFCRGKSLQTLVKTPLYDCRDREGVPVIDSVATLEDDGTVTLLVVNRDMTEDVCLSLDMRSFGGMKLSRHISMHNDDVKAVNTEENPTNVVPCDLPVTDLEKTDGQVIIPALSWNVLRFSVK